MKRYTADFEVVDGSTGYRYAPGELIQVADDDTRFDDVKHMFHEVTEAEYPTEASTPNPGDVRRDVVPDAFPTTVMPPPPPGSDPARSNAEDPVDAKAPPGEGTSASKGR